MFYSTKTTPDISDILMSTILLINITCICTTEEYLNLLQYMYYLLTRANGLLILIHNTCSCSVFFVLNKNKSMFICYRKVLSYCSVILGKMFGFGAFNNNNLSKSLLEYLKYFIKVFKTISHDFFNYWHCRPNRPTFGIQITTSSSCFCQVM